MRNSSRRSSRWKNQPDISLNAFLDLILNILLFFVFATELAVIDAIDVSVPKTEYSDALSTRRDAVVILITQDNQYLLDGEKVPMENLATRLSAKKNQGNTLTGVIIRGDLHSNLQATVDVLGACRIAGIDKVKIETERPAQEPRI